MEHIASVLRHFGVECLSAEQIYRTAWRINSTHILKVGKDAGQLKRHVLITEQLRRFEMPVAQIVPTLSGEAFLAEGECYYLLSKILPGKHMENIYEQDNHAIAKKSGEVIARLHQALLGVQPFIECWNNSLLDEMQGWIKDVFESDHFSLVSKDAFDATVLALAETYHQLPRQLIHRDIHFGNFLFENDEVTGYIDFDLSQINCRIFDLCYFASGLLVDAYQDAAKSEKWIEILKGILAGYESKNRLIPVEKHTFVCIMECIELLFIAYFSKNNSPALAENAANMYKWVEQNKSKIKVLLEDKLP